MTTRPFRVAALALPLAFTACKSGPVVPVPPRVGVSHFNSTYVNPDVVRFVGKVRVENLMRGRLQVTKVDYGADLHGAPLFTDTFERLPAIGRRRTQTITLPFQIAMKDIAAQAEDVAAEGGVRVTFRGTVFPEGFAPAPFESTITIPLPKVPLVGLEGIRGNPMAGELTFWLTVANPNEFPLSSASADAWVVLNGKRYDVVTSESCGRVAAGATGRIALTMRSDRRQGIGMLVNMAKNKNADFTVHGAISCATPYGTFELPVELASSAAGPAK